jgi:transcriptional regulator with XRE-family HTH domain
MNKVVQMRNRKVSEESGAEAAPREYHRVPWSGNLDEAELNRPGGLLLAALIRCANERRQQLNDMSRELGVTYGYINQLRNGLRQTNQISDDFALACARYLGVPRLTVLMLSGRITPEDAFESEEVVASELPRALAYLCEDPEWGPLVPPEVRTGSYRTQFLVVRLYEETTGKRLLPERLNARTLAVEIEKLQALQEQRREAVDAYVAKKRNDGGEAPPVE